jgi:DNA-binding response OmpR family regulator
MRQVLVIDDEPEIGGLIALCLDPMGVSVVQASGLQEAVEIAGSCSIGLVLLDLALGDDDGLAILPELRETPGLASVPVVAFTAHDSRRDEAFAQGVDSFLARPFATKELCSTVSTFLTE